jgi:eight-cysteine-cluster-containing protein
VSGATLVVVALVLPACDKGSPPPGSSTPSPAEGGATPPNEPTDPPTADPPAADPPAAQARKAAVPADHALYARFEGTDFPNDCKADGDCHAAGCSGEVCSADAGVITTCDVPLVSLPAGTQCGCVSDQCIWWNADGATLPEAPPPSEPPPSEPPPTKETKCGDKTCKAPRECIEYYGIAGPRGPKFHACEIRCRPGKGGCPKGLKCTTIADGPGSVCR